MSAKNQPVSRKCHSGSVSQKPASQLEVFSQPRLGGSVASSKEVQISRKPKQVKSQPEVETVSQPETSQSSESDLAAAIRWASGVVEGSLSQPKSETSRKSGRSRNNQSSRIVSQPKMPWRQELSQPEVEAVNQPETS